MLQRPKQVVNDKQRYKDRI